MNRLVLLVFFTITSLFSFENTFSTAGYIRVQTSLESEKENLCFKAPGAATKYRLGNECETWGEFSLLQDIELDNGVVIHNEIMPVFLAANAEEIEYLRLDKLYSEVFNLVDDNSVSFWIGRRWHQRYDSHITDYFFLNMSGDGLGFNYIDVGEVKVSYSFMFNDTDSYKVSQEEKTFFSSHDLRVLKELDRGDFTLFLNYMQLEELTYHTGEKVDALDGYAVGLIYKDKKIFNELFGLKGSSTSAVFYGEGLSRGAGSYSPFLQEDLIDTLIDSGKDIESSQTLRFINYNDFQSDTWGVMSNAVYENRDDKELTNTNQEWVSFGLRPYWFFHKNVRAVAEFGYDSVDNKVSDNRYELVKTTTALEFALDRGVWERPVFRMFYTKAWWNDAAQGLIATDHYANETSGDNIGVQLEYWW